MSVDNFEFVYEDREIALIDLLPLVYHPIQDFKSMTNTCGRELSELYSGVTYILESQFISDASPEILAKWEKYLGVTPNGTDTLEERRFRVLAKLNDSPPYTDKYLVNKLTELCGTDNFRITRDYSNYNLTIELSLDSLANTETVRKLVRDIIPANLVLTVKEYHARYNEVGQFTHEELTAYTYDEIAHAAMLD